LFVAPACVPIERYFGPFPDQVELFSTPRRNLGMLAVLALMVVSTLLPPVLFRRLTSRLGALPPRAVIPVAALLLLTLLWWVASSVFTYRPLFVDEVACLLQAKIFASGHIVLPAPRRPEFFVLQNMVTDEHGWYSQYPPGHPLLLAAGVLLGMPYAVPCLLSALTGVILWQLAGTLYGRATALLTALLTLLCPFFFLMGASLFNHVPALFLLACSLSLFAKWEARPSIAAAALCGFSLGAAIIARPLCGVAGAAVIGWWWVGTALERRAWKDTVAAGAAGLLPLLAGLVYNAETTGGALTLGYVKLWGEAHTLGFHQSPWGQLFSPVRATGNLLFHFGLLNLRLFEWPLPCLLPVALYLCCLRLPLSRWDRRLVCWTVAFPLAYFFYWHRDSILGPRYVYASLAGLLPLTARSIVQLAALSAPAQGEHRLPKAAYSALHAGLIASLIYTATMGIPERFEVYGRMMPSMRLGLRAEAAKQGIQKGLVFVPISWGGRTISLLRGAGVPASVVEDAYRKLDHCFLSRVAKDLHAGKSSLEVAARELRTALEDPPRVSKVKNAPDPTLRFRTDVPPTPECVEEVRYDSNGFSILSPYLAESFPPDPDGFVVAADLRDQNRLLRAEYPMLPAFLYRDGRFEPLVLPQ
jgi:hypothetical protein